jgi:hypothetical protein
MAAGMALAGYGAFTAVKLVGYCVAGLFFRRRFASPATSALKFGVTRTLIGMAFGVAIGGVFVVVQATSPIPFMIALAPIRYFEWHIVFARFFKLWTRTRMGLGVDLTLGTLWSYALDAIAILAAFAIPGGFWVC